jgi:hypothetical protein
MIPLIKMNLTLTEDGNVAQEIIIDPSVAPASRIILELGMIEVAKAILLSGVRFTSREPLEVKNGL